MNEKSDQIKERLLAKLATMEKIPNTEFGQHLIREAINEALEGFGEYRIEIEPMSEEDKRLRRAPRIKLIFDEHALSIFVDTLK